MATRRVLLVTPTMPAADTNGLAMRAGLLLEGLACHADVTLDVVPVFGDPPAWSAFVRDRTGSRQVLGLHDATTAVAAPARDRSLDALRLAMRPALSRMVGPTLVDTVRRQLAGGGFTHFIVMRSYLAPLLASADGMHLRTWLDLDDDEVETRRQIAALHEGRGEPALAAEARTDADRFLVLEDEWVRRTDALSVCSEADRLRVGGRTGHPAVFVVPNGAPLHARMRPSARDGTDAVRLLFVGSFGYLPNADAAVFLCREVLPRLRQRLDRRIEVRLVGTRPPEWIRALAGDDVTVHADVPDVAPYYRSATMALAPVRAGGGSRIKILEAFALGVPVVATPAGAAGLEVEHGRHLLIGDTADAVAACCARVADDPALAAQLVDHAACLVRHSHTAAAITQRLGAVLDALDASAR